MNIKFNIELDKMKNEIFEMKEKNEESETKIEELKSENEEFQSEIEELRSENIKKDIKIDKLSQDIKEMKKSLEIISFRDLTKKILDNMIKYVDKNDKTLLKGLTKRKDKLNEIKQKYKYKYNGIYFMKKPIEEIIEKYYSSNSKSHVPKIVQIIKAKPYGLVLEPEK